jgi:hypothetical protein
MHLLPNDFEVRNSLSGVNAEDKEKGFQYILHRFFFFVISFRYHCTYLNSFRFVRYIAFLLFLDKLLRDELSPLHKVFSVLPKKSHSYQLRRHFFLKDLFGC